jgi:hypothetical protein
LASGSLIALEGEPKKPGRYPQIIVLDNSALHFRQLLSRNSPEFSRFMETLPILLNLSPITRAVPNQ